MDTTVCSENSSIFGLMPTNNKNALNVATYISNDKTKNSNTETLNQPTGLINCMAKDSPTGLRKRNVNFETINIMHEAPIARIDTVGPVDARVSVPTADDDGFESFNGKSSSGEDNTNMARQRTAANSTAPVDVLAQVNPSKLLHRKRDSMEKLLFSNADSDSDTETVMTASKVR